MIGMKEKQYGSLIRVYKEMECTLLYGSVHYNHFAVEYTVFVGPALC